MGSVNKVILVGNLGRDAEVKYTPTGAVVAHFSLATTETWTDRQGNKQSRTEWHAVDLWGKSAEALSEYLVKGKQVYLEGKLQTDEWTDKEGNKRKTTKVRAERIVLLSGGGQRDHDRHVADETTAQLTSAFAKAGALADDDDESIPF